jgi:outer membrane protein insertion porin family
MTTLLVAVVLGGPAALEVAGAHRGPVRDVRYVGADHLSSWELRALTGIRPGDRMDPRQNERGRQAILKKYQEDGRYYASVELAEGGRPTDTRVVYRIVEGPVVKVAAVEFVGNENVKSGRLRMQLVHKREFLKTIGGKFREETIVLDREALVDYYHTCGFLGVAITPEVKPSADMSHVTIVYHIVEEPVGDGK